MLTTHNLAMALVALLAGVFGVALLYISWSKRLPHRSAAVILGWLLIAASVYFWIGFGGVEFGPVLALAQLSVIAWLIVLTNSHVRPHKGRVQEPGSVNLPPLHALGRHAAIFLVAVPLGGASVTFLVLAASRLIPGSDVDRIAFSILVIPVAWGLAVYWACADSRLLRPAIGIVAGGTAGAALIFR